MNKITLKISERLVIFLKSDITKSVFARHNSHNHRKFMKLKVGYACVVCKL